MADAIIHVTGLVFMSQSTALRGCSVLLVETEPILALEIEHWLERAGAEVIVATLCETALPLAERSELRGAVVEYMLRDRDCFPVLERLAARHIPTLVYTAHSPPPSELAGFSVIDKLMAPSDIAGLMEKLVLGERKKLLVAIN
jgi:DNA-binding response OmpR family regulator